jgi:hypothetical protein
MSASILTQKTCTGTVHEDILKEKGDGTNPSSIRLLSRAVEQVCVCVCVMCRINALYLRVHVCIYKFYAVFSLETQYKREYAHSLCFPGVQYGFCNRQIFCMFRIIRRHHALNIGHDITTRALTMYMYMCTPQPLTVSILMLMGLCVCVCVQSMASAEALLLDGRLAFPRYHISCRTRIPYALL